MASRVVLKVGDVFEIALSDGRFSYCRYINRNDQLGFLIQVFRRISTERVKDIEDLNTSELLFPPVFVGLQATARSGRWKRIGNIPVTSFEFPKFRQALGTKPGTYENWWIWDGAKERRIGKLPKEYRSLELMCVWGDEALEERILAGTYRGDQMF